MSFIRDSKQPATKPELTNTIKTAIMATYHNRKHDLHPEWFIVTNEKLADFLYDYCGLVTGWETWNVENICNVAYDWPTSQWMIQ
jgi:hypothetical protein